MNILNKLPSAVLIITVILGMALQGCIRDKCNMTYTYMEYTPTYMSAEELRSSVKVEAARDLKNPGKIYTKGNYLFVNEIAKGVHVIDNSDPSNPSNVAFINVPGNYDLSANCDYLYLDNSIDLIVMDISNPATPMMVERQENAFPHIVYFNGYQADPNLGVVVEWVGEIKETAYDCKGELPNTIAMNRVDPLMMNNLDSQGNLTGRGANPTVPGQAGSMSRFAVIKDHLYIITPTHLKVYDAQDCAHPTFMQDQEVSSNFGTQAETIFGFNDLLLIGSNSGMFIFDNTNPDMPSLLSMYDHVTACDPVVADGDYAYVTLRADGSNRCPGWTNQLDVINISNPASPQLESSYQMSGPQGLGIDKNTLFLCDGDAGLKVFSTENPTELSSNSLGTFPEMNAYDVIPHNGVLIMVGDDGIVQYDYKDINDLKKLSTIPVVK